MSSGAANPSLNLDSSIGLVTSAIPWLAEFTNAIPGTAETMKQFREFSRQRVIKRLQNGYIPEGTTTNVHNYTLQRDVRSFSPLPESFVPERWLTEEEQLVLEPELFKNRDRVVHNMSAFIPFSYGPADCVGKRLAMQELRAVTYAILQRFNLNFATGYDRGSWEADMCDFFVIRKAKLSVVLTMRSDKGK
ncbi:hypothetical protein DXG01_007865 [Tephrocybe rancida]|nr:hypothetical protein DXG01_007865 [Tephrocybe rancida]